MLPDDLAKTDTEHAHQRAFFQWLNFAARYGFEQAKILCDTEYHPARSIAKLARPDDTHPELRLMHAIPNGGFRNKSEAGKLKAEGVKPGVLDTFLPVPKPFTVNHYHENGAPHYTETYNYAGLYVEFKEPKRRNHAEGGMSDTQMEFADAVRHQGYCARVAYTWREAANVVMLYYGVDTRFETA